MSPWDEKSKNDQFKQLEKANAIGAFVTKSFTKIRDFYASNGSADSVMNCDTAAMMCAVPTHGDRGRFSVSCAGNRSQVPRETEQAGPRKIIRMNSYSTGPFIKEL